jgi:acetylxylan esterase
MVKYAIDKYAVDKTKIFATGSSSGGMMTNVLAATYPDLFSAGAVFSGVAAGCLAGSPGSSPSSADPRCASGKIVKTPDEWATVVKNAYPAWGQRANATWPRMQIWHGKADTFVSYLNMAEMLKQWSAIHGVSFSKNVTNTPLNRYTEVVYGDGSKIVGYSAEGVGHIVPTHEATVLKFFGL